MSEELSELDSLFQSQPTADPAAAGALVEREGGVIMLSFSINKCLRAM